MAVRFVFVTGNAKKLAEVTSILAAGSDASSAFELSSQDLDLPEIQGTTREVAAAKVKAAAEVIGGPCITEVRVQQKEDAQRETQADLDQLTGYRSVLYCTWRAAWCLHQSFHDHRRP